MSNNKSRNIRVQVGITLVLLSLVLFVFTTFEFLMSVKLFFLGVFGVMFYSLLLFMFLFGIALLTKKKFMYSPKYIVLLFLAFFFFVCIVHIIFTTSSKPLNYSQYLNACYDAVYSPGGVFIGMFTYPVTKLLHDFAGIVIYGIALIISIYFILNYLDNYKQQKQVVEERPEYETFHFEKEEPKNLNLSSTERVDETEQILSKENKEDDKEEDIFIRDEEAYNAQQKAKEILGIIDKKSKAEDNLSEKTEETWQNRAMANNKPEKIMHNPDKTVKRENPIFEKSKEYLTSIYDYNNHNDNPIINAEDYDDYVEKMKYINQKNSTPLSRDEIRNEFYDSDKNLPNSKKINQFEIEPQRQDYNNANNISSLNDNFDENEKDDFDSIDIEIDDDFIKPTEIKPNYSPLNPNSLKSDYSSSIDEDINANKSQRFVEEEHSLNVANDTIEESLGQTVNLNTNRNFNFDILGGGGNSNQTKEIVPDFSYKDGYIRPSIDLLKTYYNDSVSEEDYEENKRILENVLQEFKIPAQVLAVRRGSAVTRYELHIASGIPVRKIHAHSSDIALALAAKSDIRIETPIRGKSAVGIEVPNNKIDTVGLKDIISSPQFVNSKAPLTFALGKDIDGNVYCCNLDKMPHLLVAGSTGSGKSVCLNALLLSLMYKTSPADLRIILVDPKRVEFAIYNDLPHLLIPKAITETKKALNAFDWLIEEMERRYTIFQNHYVKNLAEYNSQPEVLSGKEQKLPYLVLVVDELADLVVTSNKKELEERIIRLTQKARAAGIHLILATQRPSVDIITGSIKINLPTRIAFAVTNFMDSKTILDQGGAEKLLGRGDMLYSPRDGEPIRVQGAFVDTPEVKAVVDFIKENNKSYYDQNIINEINSEGSHNGGGEAGGSYNSTPSVDSLMPDAMKVVIENGQASISMLQRRFAIGYQRAAKIIDQMEMAGFISPSDGSKPRTVYMTMADYNKYFGGGN